MQEFQVSHDKSVMTKLERRKGVDYIIISNGKNKIDCPLGEWNSICEVFHVPAVTQKTVEEYYVRQKLEATD